MQNEKNTHTHINMLYRINIFILDLVDGEKFFFFSYESLNKMKWNKREKRTMYLNDASRDKYTLKSHLIRTLFWKNYDGNASKQNVIYSFIAMRINWEKKRSINPDGVHVTKSKQEMKKKIILNIINQTIK